MLHLLTPNNKTALKSYIAPKPYITLKSYIAWLAMVLAAVMILSSPALASPQKKQDDPVEKISKTDAQSKDAPDKTKPIELPTTGKSKKDARKPIADSTQSDAPDNTKTAVAKSQSCFKQDSGAYECVCDNKKDCVELTKSGICEPGTEWKNAESFGGCTKKTK